MRSRTRDADMTQGSIFRHMVAFAVPMMMGLLFQQLYNTVDTIVVGQFVGKEALAAVGSTGAIINTLVGFSAGLSTGSSVVISQCYGAHDHKKLGKAVHTTLCITFLMAIAATLLGRLLTGPLLRMMSTPADVFDEAKIYLDIYFSGIAGLLIYNMGSGILRAVGDSRRPLYFLLFSASMNTALDLLFVIVFRLGIRGVAYATILSQFVSALLILWVLTRDHGPYGLRWKQLSIDREMVGRIFSIGLPGGIQQALTSFSNVFVQSYINFFGSACMAGWSSYNKLDIFLFLPAQAIAMASTTFVGQNYGAKQMKRAKEGVRDSLIMSIACTATLAVMVMIFAEPLNRLFTAEKDVMEYGVYFIRRISPFYVACCFNQIYGAALRGIGSAKVPMVIMLFSFVFFRQLFLLVVKLLGHSLIGVSMAYPAGWIMCSTLLFVFYRRSALYKAEDAVA
ncbi:MAG: MATE family efflux transporter [bacterium]|nr:MATE family efflux transporter [bacterium]